MRFRTGAQLLCLALFLGALGSAAFLLRPDLFLRMDPALVGITAVAARILKWIFLPALLVLISAPLFGRIFCGYICPMGTTIDLGDRCVRTGKHSGLSISVSPRIKLLLLAFVFGAAVLGVNLVFWISPIPLITRFYGLVVYPVVLLIANSFLGAIRPVADWSNLQSLAFYQIANPRYATQFFVLLLFIAIFAGAFFCRRFWCRYLCPSGAILALLSRRPLIRRQVNDACNKCGKCVSVCPMDAIDAKFPERTRHDECIVCRKCELACPGNAIRFSLSGSFRQRFAAPVSSDRRSFLAAGLAGAGTAAVSLTGLTMVTGETAKGQIRDARLLRPPGALPEPRFLSTCVRCGECMTACPTNTLQPVWFSAGVMGMFSPAVTPRRNYCDPRCTVCGQVCPTGAIQPLTSGERIWAKIGTAVIFREKCLAWEYHKSCMVCDEVCPFGAVAFENREDLPFPVPHVEEDRCAGCGFCENACPVTNDAAIVVTPMNALHLPKGASFEREAKNRGFDLRLQEIKTRRVPDQFMAPGSRGATPEKQNGGKMAPGFDNGI